MSEHYDDLLELLTAVGNALDTPADSQDFTILIETYDELAGRYLV